MAELRMPLPLRALGAWLWVRSRWAPHGRHERVAEAVA